MTGMETAVADILEDSVDRPLCEHCGLPLIPVAYGTLTLWRHGDPDECERTCEAERGALKLEVL